MKILLVSFCLCLIFTGCNTDKSKIKSLINEWVKVNPNVIGGPSELKNLKEIKEIKIGDILPNKSPTSDCSVCKDAQILVTVIYTDGATKQLMYVCQNYDGEWEIIGDSQGQYRSPISMETIKARNLLDPLITLENKEHYIEVIKTDILAIMENKAIVTSLKIENVIDVFEEGDKQKKITFGFVTKLTSDYKSDEGIFYKKGINMAYTGSTFIYSTRENRLKKIKYGKGFYFEDKDTVGLVAPKQKVDSTDIYLPKSLNYKGKYIDAIKYNDKNGTNYVIISELKNGEYGKEGYTDVLFGCGFSSNGQSFKKLWETQEASDIVSEIEYIKGSLKSVDIDSDGIIENIFLYQKSGDGAGAIPLKLMLHSGSKKYPIRGEYCPEKEVCGDYSKMSVGDEFSNAPMSFKSYSTNCWNKTCATLIK